VLIFERFRSTGFNHNPWNLNRLAPRYLAVSCSLPKDRGVFVKTVFSASERSDSAPIQIGARTVSLVCQKMFTTREERVRSNPRIQSVPVFFSAITPGQHVREPAEWLTRKLGNKEAGPLKFSRSPRVGYPEKWPFLTPWRLFPSHGQHGKNTPKTTTADSDVARSL
jgi:hypothetical protein